MLADALLLSSTAPSFSSSFLLKGGSYISAQVLSQNSMKSCYITSLCLNDGCLSKVHKVHFGEASVFAPYLQITKDSDSEVVSYFLLYPSRETYNSVRFVSI